MAKRPILDEVNNTTGLIGIGPLPGSAPVASFNLDAIESLINTKGFECLHYRFVLSPDRESLVGGDNPNTQGSQRGGRYFSVRKLKVVPQAFKLSDSLTTQGIYDINDVLLNISGNYTDGDLEVAYVMPRDLIVIPSITIPTRQLVEYNPNGPLSLNFKVKGVEYLASRHHEFKLDRDFTVANDKIVWLDNGLRPNFIDGHGDVLTVLYWACPLYLVRNLIHSLRLLPDNEFGHGGFPRRARYAPQLIVASQAFLREAQDLMDYSALPPYSQYPDSKNSTGGG